MIIIGVDPGKHGGIVTLTHRRGLIVQSSPMVMTIEFAKLMNECAENYGRDQFHVIIEKAQVMGKEGAVSMFNYGDHFGQLQGVLIALRIAFTLVPPVVWTKVMHMGVKTDLPAKKKSLVAFQRLSPEVTFIPTGCRVPHDGMVDAYLIAEWGRRHLGIVAAPQANEVAS